MILATAGDEGDFIVPPHDIAPVRLIVFLELRVELQVLPDTHHDVIWGDARIRLITALIPFALTEVEGTHAQGDINDGTLLRSLILNLNSRKLGILVTGHEQDSALGKLLEQIAGCEAILVGEVSERFLLAVDQFELQRRDLKHQLETLSLQVKKRNIVCNASEFPALVWVVSAAGLKHGHWGKLQRGELNLPFREVERCHFTSMLVTPLLLILIPDGYFDFSCVITHIDRIWKLKLDLYADVCSNVS